MVLVSSGDLTSYLLGLPEWPPPQSPSPGCPGWPAGSEWSDWQTSSFLECLVTDRPNKKLTYFLIDIFCYLEPTFLNKFISYKRTCIACGEKDQTEKLPGFLDRRRLFAQKPWHAPLWYQCQSIPTYTKIHKNQCFIMPLYLNMYTFYSCLFFLTVFTCIC